MLWHMTWQATSDVGNCFKTDCFFKEIIRTGVRGGISQLLKIVCSHSQGTFGAGFFFNKDHLTFDSVPRSALLSFIHGLGAASSQGSGISA
ncbi:hypothetical protein SUGI_1138280 [Cryptomeria japonica]|nr:hypothetical protein SUGI_1138280 [Cryptomeria japonica]